MKTFLLVLLPLLAGAAAYAAEPVRVTAEPMEFPVMTEASITPGGEKGAWLLKAGGKVLRLTVAAEGAGAWSFKREDIERTVVGHAVTRLALTFDEPAKAVKVTTVFRPETAL